jgi:serine/threonine-protein kinase HipA
VHGTEATLVNAMSEHRLFGLTQEQAEQAISQVSSCVDDWKTDFKSCGVTERDIDTLTAQIDRPFLRDQRRQ